MSLYDAVKEIEKEEKLAAGETVVDEQDPPAQDDEAGEGDPADNPEPEGDGKDDKPEAAPAKQVDDKSPPAAAAEQAPDDKAHARLRWEASEAKKRAEAAEAEIARLKNPPPPPVVKEKPAATPDPEPDASLDPEAHLRWQVKQANEKVNVLAQYVETQQIKERREAITSGAMDEYVTHEDRFKEATPDYEAVTKFGLEKLTQKIRESNPNLQGNALVAEIKKRVLTLAAQGEHLGFNPVEFVYLTSKNWGYQPAVEEKPAAVAAEKPKPDFKKIVDHKNKSVSSMTSSGSNGKPQLSRESAGGMKFHEVAELSPAAFREWEAAVS